MGVPKIGRIPITIPVMIIAGLITATGCQSAPETVSTVSRPLAEGEPAPDFKLKDVNGETVSLRDLRGKPVVLNFWATWCYWCFVEIPFLEEAYEEWTSEGLVVLMIAKGERLFTAYNYIQRYNLSLPVLLDTQETVASQYGVRGIPVTFFIDRDGIIQGIRMGAFQSKEAVDAYIGEIIP